MFKFFCVILLVLGLSSNVFGTEIHTNLPIAKEVVGNKSLLIIFEASWCKYCGYAKDDLFNSKISDDVIICLVDYDSSENLVKYYNIKTLPTFIIEKKGKIVSKHIGYEKIKYKQWLMNQEIIND